GSALRDLEPAVTHDRMAWPAPSHASPAEHGVGAGAGAGPVGAGGASHGAGQRRAAGRTGAPGARSGCTQPAAMLPAAATGGLMGNRMQDLHVEHVQALDDEGLAALIKAMAFDIPRMQALLAIARREVRRRKRAARGPSA